MPRSFSPRLDVLPAAQRELWPALAPLRDQGFVLHGGTAAALRLGHRVSIDFDFFSEEPLDRRTLVSNTPFLTGAKTIQDEPDTLTVMATMPSGSVKIST